MYKYANSNSNKCGLVCGCRGIYRAINGKKKMRQYEFDILSDALFVLGINTKVQYESRKAVIAHECPENPEARNHLITELNKGTCEYLFQKLKELSREYESLHDKIKRDQETSKIHVQQAIEFNDTNEA